MVTLNFRDADQADLPFIIGLIDGDPVSAARDAQTGADAANQLAGLRAITADPNHRFLVAELDGQPVGSFQLSFIPGVSRRGTWRGQIESVRVSPEMRGQGIGRALIEAVYARADAAGAPSVYWLTQDFNETARKLYDRIGTVTPFIKYARPA